MRLALAPTLALLAASPAGPAPRWDPSAVEGAGLPDFSYRVTDCVPGLKVEKAVHVEPLTLPDGSRALVVASTAGAIRLLPLPAPEAIGSPEPFFDLRVELAARYRLRPGQTAFRLFGTLLETDLSLRPHLYLFYNNRKPAPATNHVARLEISSFEPFELGEMTEVISWESGGHNGGDLAWGPDGMLYISAGDRSAPGDPNNWGQRTDDIFGSILRIDVRGADREYRVPADNPFVGIEEVRPEIWSYGLRNPWRFAFHPDNGELWAGDNGDENWELVHKIEKGANAGWSAFEGSAVFRASNPLSGPTLTHTPAAVQHPHSEMRSVIGGLFYRGEALPELRDHYLYGCYFTRRLWAFSYRDGQIGTPFQVADSVGQVVSITEDHDREPVITCHSGEILRLVARSENTTSKPWPSKLSKTGLFDDTAQGVFAPGVYPYTTNAAAWSDGATKNAFVAVAGGKPMVAPGGIQIGKGFDVPQGSIVGQTLRIGGKPVETQLLHFDTNWRPFTYRWDEDGTDAELVPEGGLDAEFAGQKWRFASRAECMACHTHRSNFTLAFTAPQLDRELPSGANQIDEFVSGGLLTNNGSLKQQRGDPTPDPHDQTLPIDTRARSYLHLNCAHCHRETGLGGRAGFQLLAGLPLEETGVLDAKPLVGLTGHPDARLLNPGNPERSELLTRMSCRGPGQMPLLGTHVVDEPGVALIGDWIRSLRPAKDPVR